MLDKLEEKKRKLDEQNKKNQKRRKELLEKEKRQRMSKLSDIGKLAFRANIDQLDDRTLFGAFLEIAKNTNDDKLKHWNKIAEDFANSQVVSEKLYSISFEDNPSQEMKKILKEKKFIWNRFRKEYYAKGLRSDLENLLKDCKVKIEEFFN